MKPSDLKDELSEEVAAILASDFTIEVTNTNSVPSNADGAITFPNLDAKSQGCKLIDTCVLYIDIRRSTELNLSHKAETVAKLYSAFVRAMTRCAWRNGGHVRGIIGDRVMVLFDKENCFVNAVETAISMNSTAQHVINKYFKANDVSCGIGIDAGRMLATKTGFRKHGKEQQAYRSLVWLGRPANVASKLTDIANKPEDNWDLDSIEVGRNLGGPYVNWREEYWPDFMRGLGRDHLRRGWFHNDPTVDAFVLSKKKVVLRPATPPILMTKAVYEGYKTAAPTEEGWWKPINVKVPGYDSEVYGGDVIWSAFQ